MSEETIASRRARIVEHLSATLGLPPDHVRAALDEIAVAATSDNGDAAVPAPPVAETTAAKTAAEPEAVPAPRRRGQARWWVPGLMLVAIAAVCALVVSLASRGHRRRPTAASESTQTVPTAPGGSATSRSRGDLLTALPGGTDHASGPLRFRMVSG